MVTNMWEELYKQHYQELLRKAVCICRNSAQAEDAVQETFLRALQNVSVAEYSGGPIYPGIAPGGSHRAGAGL